MISEHVCNNRAKKGYVRQKHSFVESVVSEEEITFTQLNTTTCITTNNNINVEC